MALTSADGSFKLARVAAGTYRVSAIPRWGSTYVGDKAAVVTVVSGKTSRVEVPPTLPEMPRLEESQLIELEKMVAQLCGCPDYSCASPLHTKLFLMLEDHLGPEELLCPRYDVSRAALNRCLAAFETQP